MYVCMVVGGGGGRLKEIVKTVCKSVWKKCAALVPTDTHSLHSAAVQVSVYGMYTQGIQIQYVCVVSVGTVCTCSLYSVSTQFER